MTKCYTILIVCMLAASMAGRAQQTTQIFQFKGSVFQKITIQSSGWYYLKASGGQGGESSNERHPGGAGAVVSGFFYFKANDSLRIAVGGMGQKGQNNGNNASGGGGGGASSIVYMRGSTFEPLLIAGGGGGGSADFNGLPGLTTNKGGDAGLSMQNIPYYVFQAGGTGGNNGGGGGIGSEKYGGAGGAGFQGDGGTHCDGSCNGSNLLSYGGQAYLSGNFGGNSGNNGGDGGWGGGGEGGAATTTNDGGGGGGGGYSGGGGGSDENSFFSVNALSGGGGGGSYVAPVANRKGLTDSSGANLWDGNVLIAGPVLDSDGDGVFDQVDNCPLPNPDQQDVNLDGIGDACQSGTSQFSFKGPAFQTYVVPKKGLYKLEARGGAGGPSSDRATPGGKGGYVSGYFLLDSAAVLRIGVGEAGQIGASTEDYPSGGGGGGASSIVMYDSYGVLIDKLLIAGGGGGGVGFIREMSDNSDNLALLNISAIGGDAYLSTKDDGSGGRVWTKREATGGGGGGFTSDGESAQDMNYANLSGSKYSVQGGKSYINGYNGGSYSGQGGGRGGWGGGGQGGTAMKYFGRDNHFTGFGGGGGGNCGGDAGGFAPGASTGSMGGTSYISNLALHKSSSPTFSAAVVPANGMVAITGPLSDKDGDLFTDDIDNCILVPNKDQTDLDKDRVGDPCDGCQVDPWKSSPGDCGCNTADADVNANGVKDCKEGIFNVYKGGRQRFRVPKTGWYLIDAKGAKGGDTRINKGGKGAQMQGYFYLDSSDVLEVIVGSVGETGDRPDPFGRFTRTLENWESIQDPALIPYLTPKFSSSGCFSDLYSGAGGGGASSVSKVSPVTGLLVIAGGGGGASYNYEGMDGIKLTCAGNPFNSYDPNRPKCESRPGDGGSSLQTNLYSGAGGGGIITAGQGQNDGKDSIVSIGGSRTGPYGSNHGGYSTGPGGNGGWGGGGEGGVYDCSKKDGHGGGGGGGGYNGGIGGDGTGAPGTGGGSYIAGPYKGLMVSGQNDGEGSVTITGPRIETDTVRSPGAYIWPRNGVTYRSSGIYVWVDSANFTTRILDLSITTLGGTLGSPVGGSLMAFPNPSDGLVTLRTPSLDVVARLEVFSVDGRLVKEYEVAARTTRFQVDLRSHGPGVYVFRMMAQGEDESVKVIVH